MGLRGGGRREGLHEKRKGQSSLRRAESERRSSQVGEKGVTARIPHHAAKEGLREGKRKGERLREKKKGFLEFLKKKEEEESPRQGEKDRLSTFTFKTPRKGGGVDRSARRENVRRIGRSAFTEGGESPRI